MNAVLRAAVGEGPAVVGALELGVLARHRDVGDAYAHGCRGDRDLAPRLGFGHVHALHSAQGQTRRPTERPPTFEHDVKMVRRPSPRATFPRVARSRHRANGEFLHAAFHSVPNTPAGDRNRRAIRTVTDTGTTVFVGGDGDTARAVTITLVEPRNGSQVASLPPRRQARRSGSRRDWPAVCSAGAQVGAR
jgi:hypothetical protein